MQLLFASCPNQVSSYGVALLNSVPPSARTFVLLALTDLKKIIFLRVGRSPSGLFDYGLSHEISPVLPAICAVLLMPHAQVGADAVPELKHQGRSLRLDSFLGCGLTSNVFRTSINDHEYAVKVGCCCNLIIFEQGYLTLPFP